MSIEAVWLEWNCSSFRNQSTASTTTCEAQPQMNSVSFARNAQDDQKKHDKRDFRHLVRKVKEDRRATLQDTTKKMTVQVSPLPTTRPHHETGLFSRVVPKKPFSIAKHIVCRLEFARKHKNDTMQLWNSVCWTDEANFWVGMNFRKPLLWKKAY